MTLPSSEQASLTAWEHVVSTPSTWQTMSHNDREKLGFALRDAFFRLLSTRSQKDKNKEQQLFQGIVNAIDIQSGVEVDGLSVSYHPTARHKAVRFVDEQRIEASLRSHFAHPSVDLPHLVAVFVDPQEFSFRTFENIISLDSLFGELDLTFGQKNRLSPKTTAYSFTVDTSAETRDVLNRLDELKLYVPPLNAGSRGGKRYIFHSTQLSQALTKAFQEHLPKSLLGGFSHVNPVFRCNRFETGDDNFHRHVDTPYFDEARNHVSRYTVLLYLTGGEGSPTLRIGDDIALNSMPAMTCVVFDQQYEHEGAPYVKGSKVFLRTELIFEDTSVKHDPKIASSFAKACYLTGESMFAPELARYADDCYNQTANAHFQGWKADAKPEAFVCKQFRDAYFVTNGYDYWFPKKALSLQECATLTILDYFNCKIKKKAFRTACVSTTVEKDNSTWVSEYLKPFNQPRTEPLFAELNKEQLFPEPEALDGGCCPFHGMWFDPRRSIEIVELYENAQLFAKKRVLPAPIVMMGTEVFLDPEKFVIESDKIHILSDQRPSPVNFAACWNYGGSPPNYVDVEVNVTTLHPLVPPILFSEEQDCYHLKLDFFRNSWMVNLEQKKVPIPKIIDLDPGDAEELEEERAQPWLDAVDKAVVSPPAGTRIRTDVWWAEDTPLICELYSYTKRKSLDE
jgi:hypothetical protein